MVIRARSANRAARRGATIVEALLYLSVAAGVIAFSGRVVQGEQTRQRNQIVASDIQMVLDATQLYVAQNYDAIVADLFALPDNAEMIGQFGLDRLVTAGFLPELFQSGSGGLRGIYGQDYTVLHRAVLRSAPAVTLANDPALDRAILTDGLYETGLAGGPPVNEELDLEVVLITLPSPGGDVDPPRPIEPQNGNSIVELTGRPATGFVPPEYVRGEGTDPVARGAFGGWELSLAPFEGLRPEIDNGGILASIVSLPVTGVVSILADARDVEILSRCADVPQNTAAYGDCVAPSTGNALFSDLVFNTWDSDGDGTHDRRPGIEGISQLEFAAPSDTNGDGTADAFGTVGNLFALSCHAADGGANAPAPAPVAQEFEVNCPTTRLRGTVVATNVTVDKLLTTQDLDVLGNATLGTATLGSAVIQDTLAVTGGSTFADVIVTGETALSDVVMLERMFFDGGTVDLLDNIPVWSEQLSFNFGANTGEGTKNKKQTIKTGDMCPPSRNPRLEQAMIGYRLDLEKKSEEATLTDTEIDQIAILGNGVDEIVVEMGGRWASGVTVTVLAQVFCRLGPTPS